MDQSVARRLGAFLLANGGIDLTVTWDDGTESEGFVANVTPLMSSAPDRVFVGSRRGDKPDFTLDYSRITRVVVHLPRGKDEIFE
jgi:hypothetical protein